MLVGAPAGDSFRVLDSFSPHRPPRRGPAPHRRAQPHRHGARARGPARLRRPPRPPPGAPHARHRHRGLPPRGQRPRVPRPGEARDRPRHRRHHRPRGSRAGAGNPAPLCCHDGGRRALLFDIGGGSTELAWVRMTDGHPALIGYNSLPVGVVTLAERWGGAGFTPDGFSAMVDDVAARLACVRVHPLHRPRDPQRRRHLARHLRHGDDAGRHRPGTATLSPAAGGRHGAERRGCRRRADQPAGDGPRGPGAASVCRPGPGRFRPARLRGVRRDHPAVARAAGDRRRPRPARGHAAAHDARRRPASAPRRTGLRRSA